MTEPIDIDLFVSRLDAIRAAGATADGLARAVVDGTGRLVDLTLEADLLRRPPRTVAQAVLTAVGKAQEVARAQRTDQVAGVQETLERRMAADVEEARQEAERRLAELNTFVSDMARMAERRR